EGAEIKASFDAELAEGPELAMVVWSLSLEMSNRFQSLSRTAHRAPAADRRGEIGMAPNRGRMM
ncbi:hypothetical protein, partial [Streptomyces sp. NPDC005568]|uniref:hypothetical protein n=1 Tax=Streptomyces sp. NPDC005568 TaxID=3156887 RepID=UPI0033B244DE